MKITYNENPLRTVIELDEFEKKELWYKIKIEQLVELLFDAHFYSEENAYFNIERFRQAVDPEYYLNEEDEKAKTKLDERCDRLLEYYINDLKGTHGGDCTCVACSCPKCYAEGLLGINTLAPYPGKHVLSKINSIFSYKNGEEWKQRSIIEALDILKNHKISKERPEIWKNSSQEDYEKYIPGWEENGRQAYVWLTNYYQEHKEDLK